MAAEEVLKLFDTYWFQYHVLGFGPRPNETVEDFEAEAQPKHSRDQDTEQVLEEEIQVSKLSRFSPLHVRSFSDQNLSNSSSDLFSLDSCLSPPRLKAIVSGKEVTEFSCEDNAIAKPEEMEPSSFDVSSKQEGIGKRGGRRRKKGGSRSLSELEFEELKGFMDLGFVFSEEDKESSLASILPGLQRLGKREKGEREVDQAPVVSRPYLSEAWEALEQRKVEFPIMNWRIPALGNEMDMKDQLRFWAHTVASTVR